MSELQRARQARGAITTERITGLIATAVEVLCEYLSEEDSTVRLRAALAVLNGTGALKHRAALSKALSEDPVMLLELKKVIEEFEKNPLTLHDEGEEHA